MARGGGAGVVAYGQRVHLVGALRRFAAAMNPGEFDARAYWLRKGVWLECRVGPEGIRCLGGDAPGWVERMAGLMRGHMRETLALGIEDDPKIAAVIAGMLYGDRAGFDDRLNEAFRRTGTMHLFAVSGQNVGVIAMAGIAILGLAGLNRWRWAVVLFRLPGAQILSRIFYRWFAGRRHRVSRLLFPPP